MKALKNYSIPELVETLHHRGLTWEGQLTRKAPLIELLVELETQQELNRHHVLNLCKSLDDLEHPLSVLVALCRYWGSKVTSEDVTDRQALQERVKGLAKRYLEYYPFRSGDRVMLKPGVARVPISGSSDGYFDTDDLADIIYCSDDVVTLMFTQPGVKGAFQVIVDPSKLMLVPSIL